MKSYNFYIGLSFLYLLLVSCSTKYVLHENELKNNYCPLESTECRTYSGRSVTIQVSTAFDESFSIIHHISGSNNISAKQSNKRSSRLEYLYTFSNNYDYQTINELVDNLIDQGQHNNELFQCIDGGTIRIKIKESDGTTISRFFNVAVIIQHSFSLENHILFSVKNDS